MTADVRDFPNRLRRNFAVDQLAEQIYVARNEAFGLPQIPWNDIDAGSREHFRVVASATLDDVDPRTGTDEDWFALAQSLTRAANTPPKDAA